MYEFFGKVIEGDGKGRQIGFPTANMDNISHRINHGVYLVEVIADRKTCKGLLHFGPKKTFNNKITAEIHIDRFDADIYGKKLKIKIIKKIRNIKKFKSVNDLIGQINKDLLCLRGEE
ncbi:MAG: riboflavin kinase [Patescibacteria group bacterium]|mgnify:CR=1 FL=1